jgi:hypothetical protein
MRAPSASTWRSNSARVAVDLCAALFEAGLGLGQLQRLDLGGVQRLLRLLGAAAGSRQLRLKIGQLLLDRLLLLACLVFGGGSQIELRRQFVDLALALDDAVGARIGNIERQPGRRQQMAGARHAAS